jgi:2TM domain
MTCPEPNRDRVYTQEEVQNILNLAIAEHAYQGEFSQSQLYEIGLDLGVSQAILQQAEQSWLKSSSSLARREEFNQIQRVKLRQKLVRFGMINAGLISINALMGFGFAWSLYILVFWGLFLGLKAWNVFNLEGEAYEKAYQRWQRTIQVRKVMNGWLDRLLNA